MKRYYYDLHIHSCLSPCADNDNTPNNLAGMASLSGLNILALTDHNTAKNCPAFFKACEKYNIIPIAGMEITSSEDIHVVCLFERLEDALRFDRTVNENRLLIKNRPDIFGDQLIIDGDDNIIGTEDYLLSNASAFSIDDIPDLVEEYGGISYPAHIDRDSNGIIAILGTFPKSLGFKLFELRDGANEEKYRNIYGLFDMRAIISSDAHALETIKDAESFFELDGESADEVRKNLFTLLRSHAKIPATEENHADSSVRKEEEDDS